MEEGQLNQEDRYTSYAAEKTVIRTITEKKMEVKTPRL